MEINAHIKLPWLGLEPRLLKCESGSIPTEPFHLWLQ